VVGRCKESVVTTKTKKHIYRGEDLKEEIWYYWQLEEIDVSYRLVPTKYCSCRLELAGIVELVLN
jgi:hypothetical protein